MFEKFFRNRAIKAFLKRKKNGVLPDISKYPTVALLLNEEQFAKHKELEKILDKLFTLKKCYLFVISNELPDFVLVGDKINFITKKNFNFFGMLDGDVQSSLTSLSYDMIVNLAGNNEELLTEEYIMTILKTSFRISFGKSYESLYDLVIDSKNADLIAKIEALHKYLSMLSGK